MLIIHYLLLTIYYNFSCDFETFSSIPSLFYLILDIIKAKQVLRSTILSSTIHFALLRLISDLVRLSISRRKH